MASAPTHEPAHLRMDLPSACGDSPLDQPVHACYRAWGGIKWRLLMPSDHLSHIFRNFWNLPVYTIYPRPHLPFPSRPNRQIANRACPSQAIYIHTVNSIGRASGWVRRRGTHQRGSAQGSREQPGFIWRGAPRSAWSTYYKLPAYRSSHYAR